MEEIIEKKHPYLEGVICRSNGEIYVPKSHGHTGGWTYGNKLNSDDNCYLTISYKSKRYWVHRLVLETFAVKPIGDYYCDHIDRNRSNNKLSNLRWVNRKENNRNKSNNRCCYQYTKSGEFIKKWDYIGDARNTYNTHHISECCKGRLKTAAGYIWSYYPIPYFHNELPLW